MAPSRTAHAGRPLTTVLQPRRVPTHIGPTLQERTEIASAVRRERSERVPSRRFLTIETRIVTVKAYERKQLLERIGREGATVGATIPDRIDVQELFALVFFHGHDSGLDSQKLTRWHSLEPFAPDRAG